MRHGSRYYDFEVSLTGEVIVRAHHPKAKQVLWGWAGDYGSTKDRGAIQLYGTEEGDFRGDWSRWKWTLDAYGVQSLRTSLRLELANPKRYESTAFDQRRARELLHGIDAALELRRQQKR